MSCRWLGVALSDFRSLAHRIDELLGKIGSLHDSLLLGLILPGLCGGFERRGEGGDVSLDLTRGPEMIE
jgi:hypothetical protein